LDHEHNFFTELLRRRFDVELSTDPDILFCSTFGNLWRGYACPRVLFTGENIAPDLDLFDAALSFAPTYGRNYYLPLYRIYGVYETCFRERRVSYDEWKKKKRIGTVFSNTTRFRTQVFRYLDRSVGVGSGGRAFNNVGGPVGDKVAFLQGYRFSFALENTSWPGYMTEKLLESYASGTVPIYWGDPEPRDWFDRGAFLTLGGKADMERLSREVLRIGDDFEAYRSMFERPLFRDNVEPEPLKIERIADFLETVVAGGLIRSRRKPVSDFQAFAWSYRWRHKQLNYRLKAIVSLARLTVVFPFIFEKAKRTVKSLSKKNR
jgi:hypothetical protein